MSLNIQKYSNCVIIITKNIAVICHFSGRVYIGGWSCNQKTGLGLEWYPGKYIYYGENRYNKREGVGIYKNTKGELAAGRWLNNLFCGHLL